MTKYIKISDVSKILNLIDSKTKKPLNHTLRYWEKKINEIKPKKINNQRYYSIEQVEKLKLINHLLKKEGLTIIGVKNILKSFTNKLDVNNDVSLKTKYFKEILKYKSNNLLTKINKIKNNGEKNSS